MQNPSKSEIKDILDRSKRIAVVGLSDRPDRTSYMVSKAMQDEGYEIIPVNPTIDEALGVKAVASLKDVEGPIDIVNVFRRSEQLPGVAEEFLQTDAPVFWAQQGLANEEAYRMITDKGRTAVISGATECELDKQGRVNIASSLLNYAKLEKECVVIGVSNRIELWSKVIWEQYTEEQEDSFAEIAENMIGFDI